MDDELNADPAYLRELGNAHYIMAGHYREKARPDMDYVADLSLFGPAASAFTDAAREYVMKTRVSGWSGIADMHQSLGDIQHANANDLDGGDAVGGSSVTGTDVDV